MYIADWLDVYMQRIVYIHPANRVYIPEIKNQNPAKQMKLIKIILLLLVMTKAGDIFATAQDPDYLIIGKDTFKLCSNPLDVYLEQKGSQTIGKHKLQMTNTGCWRGYVATWLLENDSLFLVRMHIDKLEINIPDEFGSNKVFAQWVTDTLRCPQGEMLQYEHDGYASIYEGDKYYAFEQGKLTGTKSANYLEKDKNRLFSGENFLRKILRRKIIESIDTAERDSLDENISSRILSVRFNQEGEISYIGYWSRKGEPPTKNINEKIILRNAQEVLKGLPQLMKVTHERYWPPTLELHFSEHCLKHPEDKEYGCNEEEYRKTPEE